VARPRRAFITDELCEEAYCLRGGGATAKELAAHFGVHEQTVRFWVRVGKTISKMSAAERDERKARGM
jgi:transposase-like protein